MFEIQWLVNCFYSKQEFGNLQLYDLYDAALVVSSHGDYTSLVELYSFLEILK